jgi:RNA polymerase primary sigma factor
MIRAVCSPRRHARKTRRGDRYQRRENHEALRERALKLVSTEIEFINNASFREARAGSAKVGADGANLPAGPSPNLLGAVPKDLPAHLARMCEAPLLSAEVERDLFRQMNYCKFRANALRARINPDAPDRELLDTAERLVQAANEIRDRIVQANMRLVISIVKKFVTPAYSFDEMLSDGIMSLLLAVDKFDYDRGFRFSTYAYRAISRNAYRAIAERQKDQRRFTTGSEESVLEKPEGSPGSSLTDGAWESLRRSMADMLEQLDRRERFILRGRYALGSHRKVRTFQSLADKLGVSKERVRQLEQRALAKLRHLAAERRMDDVLELATSF